jgi:hypothetical protein
MRGQQARFQAEWVPVSRPESAQTYEVRARPDAKPVATFADRALCTYAGENAGQELAAVAQAFLVDSVADSGR